MISKGFSLKIYSVIFLSFLISSMSFSQKYDNNFGNPMHIEMLISGNYGELRPNHFHSGLDFKTNGKEGQDLLSIEDGYVSRINISPWGYGKAVYITHPNGYTSVYAHISKFNTEIETYIRSLQYKNKTYTIDTILPKDFIKVKKGEFIAYSGNTGNSFGPHLHFEIRTTNTEHPLNPLLFGYDIKDTKAP
jgi:murein DD-endopeptidase MepM/ murein hydrolase activator NlpD